MMMNEVCDSGEKERVLQRARCRFAFRVWCVIGGGSERAADFAVTAAISHFLGDFFFSLALSGGRKTENELQLSSVIMHGHGCRHARPIDCRQRCTFT